MVISSGAGRNHYDGISDDDNRISHDRPQDGNISDNDRINDARIRDDRLCVDTALVGPGRSCLQQPGHPHVIILVHQPLH